MGSETNLVNTRADFGKLIARAKSRNGLGPSSLRPQARLAQSGLYSIMSRTTPLCLRWVSRGRTRPEQIPSALTQQAEVARTLSHFAFGPEADASNCNESLSRKALI